MKAMTVDDLHKIARPYIPGHLLHAVLHDYAAEQFHVGSLRDCTELELRKIADWVRTKPRLTPPEPKPRNRRGPTGKPAKPGVLRPMTDRQAHTLNSICSEMGWSQSTFNDFMLEEFGLIVKDVWDLGSSAMANEVFRKLKGIKKSKEVGDRPRRRPAGKPVWSRG